MRFRDGRAKNEALPLGEVLRSINHPNTTDSRDRIYGVLGLTDDRAEIIPDYKFSVQDVYTQAAKHLVSHWDLSIITFLTGGLLRDPLLPSWVSDWNQPLDRATAPLSFSARQGIYSASGNLSPEVEFSDDDRVMSMRGMLIDTVDLCGDVMDV
jgi:hypothetical protein